MDASATAGLMARLKAATHEQHRHAESRPLQRQMASGRLDRAVFVRYLEQLLGVHEALELQLERHHAMIGTVYREHHRRVPALELDIQAHGASLEAVRPEPPTAALIGSIEQCGGEEPVALLGHLYVLEGSMNGNRFIARALRRAYDLPGDRGLAYLDPYGEAQADRWQAFRQDMDRLELSPRQEETLIRAAGRMFEGITLISEWLLPPPTPERL